MWAVTKHGTKSDVHGSTNTKPVQQQFCNPFLSLSHSHTQWDNIKLSILPSPIYRWSTSIPLATIHLNEPSGAQYQVHPPSSVILRGQHLMASLCSSDLNWGVLQLPLGMYFLRQRVKPHILHSLQIAQAIPAVMLWRKMQSVTHLQYILLRADKA